MKFPLRLGVVGPGIIWNKMHSKSLAAHDDKVAPVAFCAASEQTREQVRAAYPGARIYGDYRKLVTDRAIDAVLVTTPIALNAEVALAALRAGKVVFVEKPMAPSIEEADALIDAARMFGEPRLYVLEQYHYARAWSIIRGEIDSGAIGAVVSFDRFTSSRLAPGADSSGYGANPWRRAGNFPLGPLFDGGIHDFALLACIFGPPQIVCADGQRLREEHGEYDLVQVLLRYESGLLGSFTHSGLLPPQCNYFHIRGDCGMIDCGRSKVTVESAQDGVAARDLPTPAIPWQDEMWATILKCVAAGVDAPYTPEFARRDIGTILAIKEAIVGRKIVQLP